MEDNQNQGNTIEFIESAKENLQKAARWALIFSVMMCVLSAFALLISCWVALDTVGFRISLFAASILMLVFSLAALAQTAIFKRSVNHAVETGDSDAMNDVAYRLNRFVVLYLVYTVCNIICLAWFMISLFTMEFYVE